MSDFFAPKKREEPYSHEKTPTTNSPKLNRVRQAATHKLIKELGFLINRTDGVMIISHWSRFGEVNVFN